MSETLPLGIDPSVLDKEFDSSSSEPVTAEEIREYAASLGESHPAYFNETPIAPPTFCVKFRGNRFFHPAIPPQTFVRGFDAQVPAELRGFFYLPFEHSEDLADQERGVAFYKAAGDADGLKWAEIHADIIRRFGRFPHRNAALGRVTTVEEQAFLDEGGFSG